MEEKENILKEGGVEEWGRELEEIGGEEVSDLVFLTSEDLEGIGIPVLKRRRFLRVLSGFFSIFESQLKKDYVHLCPPSPSPSPPPPLSSLLELVGAGEREREVREMGGGSLCDLVELTDEDLKEMGIKKLRRRRVLHGLSLFFIFSSEEGGGRGGEGRERGEEGEGGEMEKGERGGRGGEEKKEEKEKERKKEVEDLFSFFFEEEEEVREGVVSRGDVMYWLQKGKDDPIAQFNLGLCFEMGYYLPINPALAIDWYEQGAKGGHPKAQYNLAMCYKRGFGVSKNEEKAVHWALLSAQQGWEVAQYNLAVWLRDDLSSTLYNFLLKETETTTLTTPTTPTIPTTPPTTTPILPTPKEKLVFEWMEKSATQGFAKAQNGLAALFWSGTGCSRDPTRALRLVREAAEKGDGDACFNLNLFLSETKEANDPSTKEAIEKERWEWLVKGAERGSMESQLNVGIHYFQGIPPIEKDEKKAIPFFLSAAEQGSGEAKHNLGLCYLKGMGVFRCISTGVDWLEKAATEHNDADAMYCLALFYLSLHLDSQKKEEEEEGGGEGTGKDAEKDAEKEKGVSKGKGEEGKHEKEEEEEKEKEKEKEEKEKEKSMLKDALLNAGIWMGRAANLNHPSACHNYGVMLQEGMVGGGSKEEREKTN